MGANALPISPSRQEIGAERGKSGAISQEKPIPQAANGFALASPLVRVGLMRGIGARSMTVRAEGGAQIVRPEPPATETRNGEVEANSALWSQPARSDAKTVAATGQNETDRGGVGPWTITVVSGGADVRDANGKSLGRIENGTVWRWQSEEAEGTLGFGVGVSATGGKIRRYRGCLEVGIANGHLRVVNEVTIETYLRGVLASEMGASVPLEALKAQAVAARTFAVYSLAHWKADGYDVRDSTDSQVYDGVQSETTATDQAVEETAGQILTQNAAPIAALFCADCGGATTPGDSPGACPNYVADKEAHLGKTHSSTHDWTLTLAPQKFAAALGRNAPDRSAGVLDSVEVVEADVSGRAKRIRFIWRPEKKGNEGNKGGNRGEQEPPEQTTEKTENAGKEADTQDGPPPMPNDPGLDSLKRKLKYYPATPTVREISGNALRTALGVNTLKSTLFTVRREADGNFVVSGHGWGHGRGLCQVGAMAWASAPYRWNCAQILQHYYRGAELARLRYSDAESEEGEGDPDQSRVSDDEKAATKSGRGHGKAGRRYGRKS